MIILPGHKRTAGGTTGAQEVTASFLCSFVEVKSTFSLTPCCQKYVDKLFFTTRSCLKVNYISNPAHTEVSFKDMILRNCSIV